MRLKKIDHIGIAVKNLEAAVSFYRDILGMDFEGIEEVAEQKVRIAFFSVGENRIELLEPTASDSPVALFLEKNKGGIHHLAYAVDDIDEALSHLKNEGVELIDRRPRRGAHDSRIAFLHPRASEGVLVELCQSKRSE